MPPTRPQRRPRWIISAERKRKLERARERRHERVNGFLRLSFRGNKIRFIQLLTPPDEWASATMWKGLPTGFDDAGIEEFTWTADDAMIRPLMSPASWEPGECCFSVAVELERQPDGFTPATYVDDHGEIRPRVGIIGQSFSNFFKPILKLDSPMNVLRIRGRDTRKERRFDIDAVGDRLPFATSLDLDELLRTLEPEFHRERLERLPPGWFAMPRKRKQLVWWLLGLSTPKGHP
jgi:hypothetical protein